MRKYITLSVVTLGLLSSSALNAADDLESMFKEGKVSGQIRLFHVDREYQGTKGNDTHRDATAVGGHLKFETADYKGLNFGAAFYTTNGFLMHSPKDDYSQNDMTLLGKDNDSYSILGEAYVAYKFDNTALKGGRVKFNSPMMGADDARMLPNLFEAYTVTNTDLTNTTLSVGHITRFAQGTFGRVYDASANSANALLSATSGYSAVDSRDQVEEFVNVGTYAYSKSTDGVTTASVVYKKDKLKIQLWDYYAHDIVNTIYGELNYNADFDSFKPFVAAQFIKQNDVGDSLVKNGTGFTGDGSIDSLYVAGKVGIKIGGFTTYVAYSQTTDNDESEKNEGGYANAIITTWGGMPAYTQGMVTRHQFLAGTKATKVVGAYSFKGHGLNLSAAAYYTSFDMDENSGYGKSRTATEPGFDIKYYPEMVKNLQLRFRGNFPRDFHDGATGSTGWNEYRFIVNYNF